MIVTHKIEYYNIVIISDYAKGGGYQMGYLHLYGENSKYLGYLGIIKNGKVLPSNIQQQDGTLNIYFHELELQTILDTFKKPNPIFVKFNTDLKSGSLVIGKYDIKTNELAA
ncbi:hypothetical protein [Aquimarina sp. AU474]|uniref:hypothetical protein n=1 Tax=Aquimarina sp. AU474 TaxID=2108529 RepID=UPI000D69D25E|nr:hypothetical protein [Aquimarina sp. AU474]